MTPRIRIAGALAALALIAAACGGASDAEAPGVADLPINPAAACIDTEPDCQDTLDTNEPLFVDGEPTDGPDDGLVVNGGALTPDGGLTVADALSSDAVGIVAVKGFLIQDDNGARLCDLLAESLPPQCGGASVGLSDISTIDPDELKSEQGVTWTDFPVTVLGELAGGVLTITPVSQ